MKTLSVLMIVPVMLLASCRPAVDNSMPAETVTTEETTIDSHNSRNSLDWAGTYSGTLPCADCEGIATVLRLDSNGQFVITTTYVGKSTTPFTEQGGFVWIEDGSTIRLNFEGNGADRANLYRVGEGNLTQLDMDGKVITGALAEMYVLTKEGGITE
jgi:uncharacterized lipoprotein NlpE involved in copper resistance